MGPMDLAAAVEELYAADPSDFVAVRSRLVAAAREAADRELATELGSLRKPTLVAWLLNQVARQEPEVVAPLTALGERMRTAQAQGDGAALTAARPERQERIEALVAATGRYARSRGVPFGRGAVDQVSSTAVAALADEASGHALASGRLLRPLTYAGFGEVELEDSVAVLRLVSSPPGPSAAEQDPGEEAGGGTTEETARLEELAAAQDDLREAERALSAARLAASEAQAVLERAREAREEATGRVEELAEEVAAAARRVEHLEGGDAIG